MSPALERVHHRGANGCKPVPPHPGTLAPPPARLAPSPGPASLPPTCPPRYLPSAHLPPFPRHASLPPPVRLSPSPRSTSVPSPGTPRSLTPALSSFLAPFSRHASLPSPGTPRFPLPARLASFNVIAIIPFVQAACFTSRTTTWDANVPRPPRDGAAGPSLDRSPNPPPLAPLSSPLPSPLPPPHRRRHCSRASTGRAARAAQAGPGRIFCTLRNVAAAASPCGVAGAAAAAVAPSLDCGLAWSVPRRAVRGGAHAAGGAARAGSAPRNSLKVCIRFALGVQDAEQVCSQFTCQNANDEKKFTSEDTKQLKKFTLSLLSCKKSLHFCKKSLHILFQN